MCNYNGRLDDVMVSQPSPTFAVFRRPYGDWKVGLIKVLRYNAVSSFLRFNPLIRIRILHCNPYVH